AVSSDGGDSWQAEQSIKSVRGSIEQSMIAIGSTGPILIYRATDVDQVLYRESPDDGRTWSEEKVIPGVVPRPYASKQNFERIGMAVDGDGRILLAYVGQDAGAPKGLSVFVSTFATGQWSEPVRVASPDGYPEYPRLAIALGTRPYLVFFVRDKQFDL